MAAAARDTAGSLAQCDHVEAVVERGTSLASSASASIRAIRTLLNGFEVCAEIWEVTGFNLVR